MRRVRYVVYGAGAIGGTIAARLAIAGLSVAAVARGEHLRALQSDGLRFVTPDGETVVQLAAYESASAAGLRDDDVVLLGVKSQDTSAALDDIASVARPAVVCAQNGVDNERQSLRRFSRTYGMLVYLPGQHLEPGVVEVFSAPVHGVLDVGCAPAGVDELAERMAADLSAAGFESRAIGDVMRWKRAKLLRNLGNALDATLPDGEDAADIEHAAVDEARACFEAAGLDFVPDDEADERMRALSLFSAAGTQRRGGSSSWQSLARATGSIEADWLNGEIALLGRLHGVPTPVNDALQALANRAAREGAEPGSFTRADLEAMIGS